MLNTYIKNRGTTKTIVHNNNSNHINQMNWDADYDGDVANISVNTNTDGIREHFDIMLDNQDLANLLNIHSVNIPLHQRLKNDFKESSYSMEPYYIELPALDLQPRSPKTVDELLSRHISSPLQNEELIVPLTIDQKTIDKYTLSPKKRHKKLKTHITYKAYKKMKSNSHGKSKSKSRSSGRKSITKSITDFF